MVPGVVLLDVVLGQRFACSLPMRALVLFVGLFLGGLLFACSLPMQLFVGRVHGVMLLGGLLALNPLFLGACGIGLGYVRWVLPNIFLPMHLGFVRGLLLVDAFTLCCMLPGLVRCLGACG